MGLSLGQILGGAGAVGRGWRVEEEAQRVAQENQLKIEAQNRLEKLRQNDVQKPIGGSLVMPALGPAGSFQQVQPTPVAQQQQPVWKDPTNGVDYYAGAVAFQTAAKNARIKQAAEQAKLDAYYADPRNQAVRDNAALRGVGEAVGFSLAGGAMLPSTVGIMGINAANMLMSRVGGAITGKYQAPTIIPFNDAGIRKPGSVSLKTPAEQKLLDSIAKHKGDATSYDKAVTTANNLQLDRLKTIDASKKAFAKANQTGSIPAEQKLLAAQQRVESNNNPNAVSPKGATGLMQVLSSTAMDPGFGLPNIFDFAASKGIQIGERDAATASSLLKIPEIGAEYGNMYSAAMAEKYGNNQTLRLIAYNMGPAATDKWLAAGSDMNTLPKETRDYVAKITKLADAERPSVIKDVPITPDGQIIKVADTKPPTAKEQMKVTDFYLADPNAVGGDMQRALRQREELVYQASRYQQAGMGNEYMQIRAAVMELDEGMYYLQGMQGIHELTTANSPLRLASINSHYAGVPIAYQPRSDGLYNVHVNGVQTQDGVSVADIIDMGRKSFDKGYRDAVIAAKTTYGEKTFEIQGKIAVENAKQVSEMIKQVAIEQTKGNMTLAVEYLKANAGYKVTPLGDGSGRSIIQVPGGTPVLFNPDPKPVMKDGIPVTPTGVTPIDLG